MAIDQERLAGITHQGIDGRSRTISPDRRFWSWVDRREGDSCWEWHGRRDENGYGRTSIGGHRNCGSHRVAWELTHGAPDKHVLHSCDNPPCCNPSHLFLGSNRDNAIDRHRKGRSKNLDGGHLHPKAKLTIGQATELRELRIAGWTQAKLAEWFGVSRGNVSKIANGESYK